MLEFMIDWWVRCKEANIWLLYIHHSTHFNHWNTVLTNPRLEVNLTNVLLFSFPPPFFIFYYFSFSFSIFYFEWIPTWLSRSIVFLNLVEVQKFTWIYRQDFHEIILEISFWIETHNAIAAKFANFFSFFKNLNSVIDKWFNSC